MFPPVRAYEPLSFSRLFLPLYDEGLLRVTTLRPETGRWSVIYPKTLDSEPQDFPETQEERLYDLTSLAWSENHTDHCPLSRVGSILHEMNHALVPNSQCSAHLNRVVYRL